MVTASRTIEEEQDYQRAAAARWEAVEGMLDTHPEYRGRLNATDADPEGVAMRLLRELIAQPYPNPLPAEGYVMVQVPELPDAELRAMALIEVAMRPLGTDAQARVARWAWDRWSEPDNQL